MSGSRRSRRSTSSSVIDQPSGVVAARWRPLHEGPDLVRVLDDEVAVVLRQLIDLLGLHVSERHDRPLVLEVELEGMRCLVMFEPAVRSESMLSPREQQIARMVAEGYPNKTIAVKLGISSWTVSTHLRRMFAKFGVRSRAALVARLLEEEFISDDRRLFPE